MSAWAETVATVLGHRLLHGLRGEGGSGEVVSGGQGEGGDGEGEVELECSGVVFCVTERSPRNNSRSRTKSHGLLLIGWWLVNCLKQMPN